MLRRTGPDRLVAILTRPAVLVGSRVPGIDHRDIESLEVARIARRDRGTSRLHDAGDQRVAQVDHTTGPLAIGSELGSRRRSHLVEGQHATREVLCKYAVKC